MYNIGWFSTGRGEGSRNLLTTIQEAIKKGQIEANIDFVFSNREPGEAEGSDLFIDLVQGYHLPLIQLSSARFKTSAGVYLSDQWRLEYDREAMKRLEGQIPDLCVLAGYMLIVGPEMCKRYSMLNLHPAAPGGPVGTWREVIWKLIEDGARETGVTIHLVSPEPDKGPVATYCTFPIRGAPFDKHWGQTKGIIAKELKTRQGKGYPLFNLIRQEGVKRELPLMMATIKALSESKIRIEDGKVLDNSGELIEGYSLTPEIEEMVRDTPTY